MNKDPEKSKILADLAEAEEELRLRAPIEPTRLTFGLGGVALVIVASAILLFFLAGVVYLMYESGGDQRIVLAAILSYFLGGVSWLLINRHNRKKTHEIYTQACKVIHYYRLLGEKFRADSLNNAKNRQ